MKTIFSTIALFSAVLFATSCTEDMEYKDSKVSSVNQLYEPTDGKEVVLQSSASASLFFEWESAENRKREVDGLLDALSFFKMGHGLILTYNQHDKFSVGDKTIEALPVSEYFKD